MLSGMNPYRLLKLPFRSLRRPLLLLLQKNKNRIKTKLTNYLHRYGWPWAKNRIKDARLIVDIIIPILTKRHRSLQNLAIKQLPYPLIHELGIKPDRLLDSNSEKAIEMLESRKIIVSRALRTKIKAPPGHRKLPNFRLFAPATVYHLPGLNTRQAELLWQNGFREIDKLDQHGRLPLVIAQWRMCYQLKEHLKLLVWYLSKGVDMHQLQPYAYQRKGFKILPTDLKSGIAALHHLAHRLGEFILDWRIVVRHGCPVQWNYTYLESIYSLPSCDTTELLRNIISDPFRDSCQCACSSIGCLAFTHMIKGLRFRLGSTKLPHPRYHWSDSFNRPLIATYCATILLEIDRRPGMAWLVSEIFRFLTFKKLELRHTCCSGSGPEYHDIIVELGDEEDREEIRLEQAEQVDRLEDLIREFKSKYQEMGIPLIDFFEGYWQQRMDEVLAEQTEVDTAKLTEIGVVRHDDNEKRVREQINKMEISWRIG